MARKPQKVGVEVSEVFAKLIVERVGGGVQLRWGGAAKPVLELDAAAARALADALREVA